MTTETGNNSGKSEDPSLSRSGSLVWRGFLHDKAFRSAFQQFCSFLWAVAVPGVQSADPARAHEDPVCHAQSRAG